MQCDIDLILEMSVKAVSVRAMPFTCLSTHSFPSRFSLEHVLCMRCNSTHNCLPLSLTLLRTRIASGQRFTVYCCLVLQCIMSIHRANTIFVDQLVNMVRTRTCPMPWLASERADATVCAGIRSSSRRESSVQYTHLWSRTCDTLAYGASGRCGYRRPGEPRSELMLLLQASNEPMRHAQDC